MNDKKPTLELTLHSGIAHMTYKLDAMGVKTWFYLVSRVFDYLENSTQKIFTIPTKDLFDYLGTRNYDHINKILSEIQDTKIKFNIFGKNQKENWISTVLLSTVGIQDGQVIFEIPLFLQQKLLAFKEMFVIINLMLLRDFRSKYALSLYIILTDFVIKNVGKTEKTFTLKELRELFDIEDKKYTEYKEFHKFVLKKAVEEINSTSSLYVTYEPYKKENKKIISIKFTFRIKKELETKKITDNRNSTIEISDSILDNEDKLIFNNTITSNNSKEEDKIMPTDKKVLSYIEKNKIVITTVKNQKRLKEIVDKIGIEKINDYFSYLMDIVKVKNYDISKNSSGEKNIGGFFIGCLHSENYLSSFFIDIEKQNKKDEEYNIKFFEELDKKIMNVYYEENQRLFVKYVETHFEQYKNRITDLIRHITEKIPFLATTVLKKNNYVIDMTVFKNLSFINEIFPKYVDDFDYDLISFDDWLVTFINKPESTEKIDKLKEEVKKELVIFK